MSELENIHPMLKRESRKKENGNERKKESKSDDDGKLNEINHRLPIILSFHISRTFCR